jgi:hypothetical protein
VRIWRALEDHHQRPPARLDIPERVTLAIEQLEHAARSSADTGDLLAVERLGRLKSLERRDS